MSLGYCLQTGVSALNSFSNGLEVIGNNVSNSDTTGFKRARVEYSDTFYNALKNEGRSMQVGSGSAVQEVNTLFDTEDAEYTGNEGDLSINGSGFFKVVDPETDAVYYTRNGSFRRDSEGYLITSQGYRLQGSTGDLQVPDTATNPTTGDTESVSSWSFSSTTGELNAYFSDGTAVEGMGQVQLTNFTYPQGLTNTGGNYYTASEAAGTASTFNPSDTALASVKSQYLEQSNVDLTNELANMIVTQRAFQAGSRVITTTDQLLQEAIKLKS